MKVTNSHAHTLKLGMVNQKPDYTSSTQLQQLSGAPTSTMSASNAITNREVEAAKKDLRASHFELGNSQDVVKSCSQHTF